ncbi:cyclase family protein [Marinihelvus fidelis]|uniref:Cyclase family protein n=1 Tax=Marinihelvus fidelis TaxID=2613842 RepID=A0A5N0T6I5_9GAMM|nr:cyclase family protein [Marinihelvus fidelis]KAA9130573.1 cyclase family protein [Marinihelvus fidelis]
MIARIDWHGRELAVDLARGRSIAIGLDPHGPQPAFFTESPATAAPMRAGGFVGSVAEGGSCNAEVVNFIPHCHGTHTECVGHITALAEHVQDTIYAGPALARVVSLAPADDADGSVNAGGPVYTDAGLAAALEAAGDVPFDALVIRARPADEALKSRDYGEHTYPVLEPAAIRRLAALPLKHLLIDTPSLDTAHDGGKLANHRTWWGLGNAPVHPDTDAGRRSITEMIFAPDDLADGWYWLQLELSPVLGDATASRPMLYPVDGLA